MSGFEIFLWGFGGSVAVEIVSIYQHASKDHRELPARYYIWWFWVVRVALAAIAGGLAVAYRIEDNPLLAVNIGAATPLIIQALGAGLGPPRIPPAE